MPVSVTERWTAFLRGRADAQASRASLAAMRHGLLPAGWVYGRGDQRQAEFDEQRRILVSRTRWPGSPPSRLAAVTDFCIRVVNRGIPAPRLSFVVQAHATSGPPAAVIRRFPRRHEAAAFAARLAQQVRAGGIEALRRDAGPDPADQS
jgi:hypothetical protein